MAIHTYTIVDAISDKNVLPFRIDYVNTIKVADGLDGQAGVGHRHRAGAARTGAADARSSTTRCEHFDQKTRRSAALLARRKRRVHGFNALFATASIDAAKRYYTEFKAAAGDLTPDRRLKIGLIYSYAANEDGGDDYLDEEGFETEWPRPVVARLPGSRDPGLQRPVRHELRHLAPTSSRTTTRICRCG